jgi:AcrR family transcriptional regulator
VSARGRTQRERLLASAVAGANREGWAAASVSKIIAGAGVSRPTFYSHFIDTERCLLAALGEIQARLLAEIRRAVDERPPQQALPASLGALVELAGADPAAGLYLTSQAMAGGPAALDARDRGIAEIEQLIEEAHRQVPAAVGIPDISPRIAIGGVQRLLAARLRRGQPLGGRVSEELAAWAQSYMLADGGRTRPRGGAPAPPAAGGATLPRAEALASHRERILHAAAQLAASKGYAATTIADILELAGVGGRTFYATFADKQDAFMALHEIGVRQVMSAAASAFFTGAGWPERIWQAGQAFTRFLESNPTVAHVGFVEAYAVGPGAVQRIEDSHVTFTIFLQEGYQSQTHGTPPSRLALEAIIASIFEIVYLAVRGGADARVSGTLAEMAFLALAPFLGAGAADAFIAGRLGAAVWS